MDPSVKPDSIDRNYEPRFSRHRVAADLRRSVALSVDVQKNKAVDAVSRLAGVVRRAGDFLHERDEKLGAYARAASDGLDRWAENLRRKRAADLAQDLSALARRRPALFVGGAFVLGLGLARFLKSTGRLGAFVHHDPTLAADDYASGGFGH